MDRTSNVAKGGVVLALDVGEVRIGVAISQKDLLIARPLTTISNSKDVLTDIAQMVTDQQVVAIVIGLPRGLEGQSTNQTKLVEAFAAELKSAVSVPLYWQDEALTSQKAEDVLRSRNKPYEKGDIDALAACYILEDYQGSREHVQV